MTPTHLEPDAAVTSTVPGLAADVAAHPASDAAALPPVADPAGAAAARRRRSRWMLLSILAVCAAPVIASYLTYYVIKPQARTNYGELVLPQRQVAPLEGVAVSGAAPASGAEPTQAMQAMALTALHGHWIFLTVQSAACDDDCSARLYAMRQVRATTGKDMERIERVLVVTGDGVPSASLLAEHPGLIVLKTDAAKLQAVLGEDPGGGAQPGRIFVVDPMGNLMMRYPPHADPRRMKKDIAKLLMASRIG